MLNILGTLRDQQVTRITSGRLTDIDGNPLDPYEFAWADFITKVSTDFTGVTIRITDIHQDSRGAGGILVTGGTSWTLESPQIYYSSFASAPNPSSYPGWRITGPWAGLGSPVLYSNGTLWRYQTHTPILMGHIYNVTKSSNKDTAQVMLQVAIPINNGKSLLQVGDRIAIDFAMAKTGTTDKLNREYRLGTLGTTSDTLILDGSDVVTTSSAANVGWDERPVWVIEDSTYIKKTGPIGSVLWQGISATTRASQVAISNLDSAINYLSVCMKLVDGAADGIADTQKIESCAIYFIHAAA